MTDHGAALTILFLSWECPPETGDGGIAYYVACIAPALADRGHQQVQVPSCVRDQRTRDCAGRWVHVHRGRQLTVRGFGRLTRSRHAVDADQRAFGWPDRLGDHLERATARRADVISSPSRLLLDDCLRSGHRTGRTHHRVVRYPIDLDRWAGSRQVEPSSTVVLSVGRFEPLKGGDVLLRAARLLTDEGTGCEVVFVGRSTRLADGSEYRTTLERLASQLDVTCRFVDQVERRRLLEWYGRARVVAVPSRYDNFPMVGLEVMTSRRPVVCTDNVGTAELLAGTDAGMVVPVEDPAALARARRGSPSPRSEPVHSAEV